MTSPPGRREDNHGLPILLFTPQTKYECNLLFLLIFIYVIVAMFEAAGVMCSHARQIDCATGYASNGLYDTCFASSAVMVRC